MEAHKLRSLTALAVLEILSEVGVILEMDGF